MPLFQAIAVSSLLWLSSIDAFTSRSLTRQTLLSPEQTTTTRNEKNCYFQAPFSTSLFMSTRDTTDFDYYRILGVSRNADTNEIKQAYRRLARLYHPDANSGKDSTAKFQEVNRAYEVLRDPNMRMHYDLEGHDGLGTSAASDDIKRRSSSSSPFGSGFGDFSSSSQRARSSDFVDFASADHTHVEFGDMSDPFYRGRGKGPRQASGGGGSSIPSDQHKHFYRGSYANEVHVDPSTQSHRQESKESVKRPFSDERFYGKNPDKSDSFFGGNRPGAHPSRTTVGDDIRVDWEIDLRKALFGGEETVRVSCKETCTTCKGIGAKPETEVTPCQGCDGSGVTSQMLRTPRGNINSQQKCMACKGTGQRIEDPCVSCSAQGMKKATKQVKITVPAFMEDGNMIRLFGEGNPGPNGGPPGDLYIFLWSKDDPTFYREGDKIYSEESIDFVDAVLGCTVKTPYFKFEVPSGTQNDHVVRLKGQGAPKRGNPKERGDHIVTVKVDIPTDLSKEEEALVIKLKELRDKRKAKK